jgi:hypothetical protein
VRRTLPRVRLGHRPRHALLPARARRPHPVQHHRRGWMPGGGEVRGKHRRRHLREERAPAPGPPPSRLPRRQR